MSAIASRHEPEEREDPRNAMLGMFEDFVRMLLAQDCEPQVRAIFTKLLPPEAPSPRSVRPAPISDVDRALRLTGVLADLGRLKHAEASIAFVRDEIERCRAPKGGEA